MAFRWHLLNGSKKIVCPDCGARSFVPYVWADTGEVISESLGRCDREQKCGHFDKYEDVKKFVDTINWQGCGLAKNWRVSKVASELLADGQDIADKLATKNNNHFIELLNNELNTLF